MCKHLLCTQDPHREENFQGFVSSSNAGTADTGPQVTSFPSEVINCAGASMLGFMPGSCAETLSKAGYLQSELQIQT